MQQTKLIYSELVKMSESIRIYYSDCMHDPDDEESIREYCVLSLEHCMDCLRHAGVSHEDLVQASCGFLPVVEDFLEY